MKSSNHLILSTSPLSQPARKPRKTARLTRRQQPLYGRNRHNPTGKERDKETGLYYYGARYLDSRTGRWLSGDPAVGDYVPEAPVDDEARKRNGNLPGQGGVFNYVNLHVYHYAGNNPVKYIDPDGREDFEDIKNLFSAASSFVSNIIKLNNKNEINTDTGLSYINGNDIIQFQNNTTKMVEAIKDASGTSATLFTMALFFGVVALDNKDAITEEITFLKSRGVNVMKGTITFESTKFDAKLTIGGVSSLETNIKFDSRNSLKVGFEIGFKGSINGLKVNRSMDIVFTRKIGR
jgi:RHS repeat-associated protein